MAKKVQIPHVCPACGSTEMQKVQWSGQIGPEGNDEYVGLWIECLACGLQGPKAVWDRMAKRRENIQRALSIDTGVSVQQQRYMAMIEGFGLKMFRELAANDAKKGDFTNWKPGKTNAASELEHHFNKLKGSIVINRRHKITEHCADLANIVMGIDASLGAK